MNGGRFSDNCRDNFSFISFVFFSLILIIKGFYRHHCLTALPLHHIDCQRRSLAHDSRLLNHLAPDEWDNWDLFSELIYYGLVAVAIVEAERVLSSLFLWHLKSHFSSGKLFSRSSLDREEGLRNEKSYFATEILVHFAVHSRSEPTYDPHRLFQECQSFCSRKDQNTRRTSFHTFFFLFLPKPRKISTRLLRNCAARQVNMEQWSREKIRTGATCNARALGVFRFHFIQSVNSLIACPNYRLGARTRKILSSDVSFSAFFFFRFFEPKNY